MSRIKTIPRLAVLLITLACGGPDGSGTGVESPDPGPVIVVLSSPNLNDGAVLFTVSGEGVTAVNGLGYEMVSAPIAGGMIRILVRGTVASGPLVRFEIKDRRAIANYRITIEQASARSTYQMQDVASYSATVRIP